jgi:RND family efflux transporter MFP subunit
MSSFAKRLGQLCVVFLLPLLFACGDEPPSPTEAVRAIRAITVTELATARMRRFSGVIEAADTAGVSFEVSGVVQEIGANVGDKFSKGQVLAVLEEREHKLNVDATQAAVGRADVELSHARADFERLRGVAEIDAGAISIRSLEQAEATYGGARNDLNYAISRLNLAKRDLESIELRAPFDGIIAESHVDAFQQISRGEKIFTVNMEGAVEAAISIPESEIGMIYLGLLGEIRFPSIPGEAFKGIVTEISQVAGTANAFPIKVTVEAGNPNIRPGITAEVSLSFADEAAEAGYLVPIGAITSGGNAGESYVFVFDAETSTVVRTAIESGGYRDSTVIVNKGLEAGDVVAVAGVSFLRDGQEVTLLQPYAQ